MKDELSKELIQDSCALFRRLQKEIDGLTKLNLDNFIADLSKNPDYSVEIIDKSYNPLEGDANADDYIELTINSLDCTINFDNSRSDDKNFYAYLDPKMSYIYDPDTYATTHACELVSAELNKPENNNNF